MPAHTLGVAASVAAVPRPTQAVPTRVVIVGGRLRRPVRRRELRRWAVQVTGVDRGKYICRPVESVTEAWERKWERVLFPMAQR